MIKLRYLSAVFFFIWGCAGRGGTAAPSPRQQAVAHSVRTYELGKVPDQDREQAFQNLLDASHSSALKLHGAADDIGFSYSLSPKGAVYPFSEVEVSCLIKKADASSGKRLCRDFFKAVDSGLPRVVRQDEER